MAATDDFASWRLSLDSPAEGGEAVTPHDTNELTKVSRALWIGGAGSGNLKVKTADGTTLAFTGVPVGWMPLRVKQVFDADTDVTDIVAVY